MSVQVWGQSVESVEVGLSRFRDLEKRRDRLERKEQAIDDALAWADARLQRERCEHEMQVLALKIAHTLAASLC